MQETKRHAYLILQSGSRWTDILKLTEERPIIIGRSSDCDVVVRDDRVSRRHASIGWNCSVGWMARDLDSRNGTQVNGQTICEPRSLEEGDAIIVGGCGLTFATTVAAGFRAGVAAVPHGGKSHQTVAQDAPPTIVERLSNSKWSSEEMPPVTADLSERTEAKSEQANSERPAAEVALSATQVNAAIGLERDAKWNFFYRLIADLVRCKSPEQAARVALDRLLDQLGLSAGGVVTFDSKLPPDSAGLDASRPSDQPGGSIDNGDGWPAKSAAPVPSTEAAQPSIGRMSVLAARQPLGGGSYRRVSDFLVHSAVTEQQAVLARNVHDDPQLSLAHASGSVPVDSIICAPLRIAAPQAVGPGGSSENECSVQEGDSGDGDQSPRTSPGRVSSGGRDGPQAARSEYPVEGILHVYSTGQERMISVEDLDFAVGVADNLAIALSRLREQDRLVANLDSSRRKIDQLESELEQGRELIGRSRAMRQVKQAIQRAGPTQATILIRGESGVGKELIARALHLASPRRDAPLVCMNCAALAPTLLESELFGHEKGAFTGATERKIGKFEAAHGGTLLLDEIGEMVPALQAKFLRVLEGQPFERLGGNKPVQTDVRIIAATNRNLEDAVQAKEFRSDLYFRLRVIEIDVPPLRARSEDIPELVEHFLGMLGQHADRRLKGIEPHALELLMQHTWPGNVRELRNVIERAIVLGNTSTVRAEDLSLAPIEHQVVSQVVPPQARSAGDFEPIALAELEKHHIIATLEHFNGNKTQAARSLRIERSTLDRKLKRY